MCCLVSFPSCVVSFKLAQHLHVVYGSCNNISNSWGGIWFLPYSWANQLAVTFKNYLMETNIFGKYDSLLQCFRFDFQRSQWELQLLTHGSNHQALVISCYHTNSAPFVFWKNSPIHIHLIPSIACGEKFCKLIIWRDKTKTKENHEDDNGMKWQSILWE